MARPFCVGAILSIRLKLTAVLVGVVARTACVSTLRKKAHAHVIAGCHDVAADRPSRWPGQRSQISYMAERLALNFIK